MQGNVEIQKNLIYDISMMSLEEEKMKPVTVRNVTIGEGIPKICVPIVGVTVEEILESAKVIRELPIDIVEWRADWYEGVLEFEKVEEVLSRLRKILGEIPILFTFRTICEGGRKELRKEEYLTLNEAVIKTGNADILDVELFYDEEIVSRIIDSAHRQKVAVLASNHDFQKTPPKEEIVRRMQSMQDVGADILKIAVMPQNKKDVIALLEATEEMTRQYADRPVVAIAMSELGIISRIAGETFGSAITFGAVGKTSAPGQIPVHELKEVLDTLHHTL